MFKLGDIFYYKEFHVQRMSYYECKVIGVKVCDFLNGQKFTDFLIEQTAMNNYHEDFKKKEDRTGEETFRLDRNSNKLTYWHEQNWPAHFSEWRSFKGTLLKSKPTKKELG